MTVQKEFKFGGENNPLGTFGGLIILILFFVALFFIAKGIFTLLSYVAPVLLILSLIIDHTAVIDFGKFIIKLFKNNILVGILAVLLTIVGFPIVAGFIFFRSIIRRKLKSITKEMNKEPEFVPYEEVVEEEDFLELPEMEHPPQEVDNDYDDLFK
jgi:hypothetical protein